MRVEENIIQAGHFRGLTVFVAALWLVCSLGLSTALADMSRAGNQNFIDESVRVLETGNEYTLTATVDQLADDRVSIDAVFDADASRTLLVDRSMFRPGDDVMTVLIETDSGFPLTLEIDLEAFGLGDEEVSIEIFPSTLDNLIVRTGINELRQIRRDQVVDHLLAPEKETHYFCQRTDGAGGSIIKATLAVAIEGYLLTVPVDVRRDAHQQEGMRVLTQGKKLGKSAWGISWFSSDCKKQGKKCPSKPCKVTLASVLKAASAAGITVPGWADTLNEVLALLGSEGISVGGNCRRTTFLGIINVGCQCWLWTAFTTGADSVPTSKASMTR